jgi:hypothetical protein
MDDIQQQIDDLYLNGPTFHEPILHKLPIEYVEHQVLSEVIRNDLEIGGSHSLYAKIIPETSTLMNQWCSLYTKDTRFLKQTQKCIKRYSSIPYSCDAFKKEYDSRIAEISKTEAGKSKLEVTIVVANMINEVSKKYGL